MNNKLHLIYDADDTLLNSNLASRKMYANEFNCVIPDEITVWDGGKSLSLAPLGWLEKAFNSSEIWQYMTVKNNVFETLDKIQSLGYFDDMKICSIGKKRNIHYKSDFIDTSGLSKYFKDCIFLTTYSDDVVMKKDFLNYNTILCDDHQKNLTSIRYPILFCEGKFKEWNKGYEGIIVDGWNDGMIDTLEAIVYDYEMRL
jgi:hypothetical protein